MKRAVDIERSLSVSTAIDNIKTWANNSSFTLDYKTVHTTTSGSSMVKSYLRDSTGALLSEAAGKGIGDQATASALYEALEHGAFKYALPGQVRPDTEAILPASHLERVDHGYKYARSIRPETPQPLHTFYELAADGQPDWGRPVYYPQILTDIMLPLTAELGKLLPLSYYVSTSGIAAGSSWHDACVHATNELVERDAEAQFLVDINSGKRSYSLIDLEADDHLYELFIELTNGGYEGTGALYSLQTTGGYVFCAANHVKEGKEELGFGASQFAEVALERALTELEQSVYVNHIGLTWESEGGYPLSRLNHYPNMKRLATRLWTRPEHERTAFKAILEEESLRESRPIAQQLSEQGFTTYVRPIWNQAVDAAELYVVQIIVPGLEGFANILFGRPMLPLGRLRKPEYTSFLRSHEATFA